MLKNILQLYKDSFGGLSKEVWLLATVMFINRAGTMVVTFLMIYLTQELGFSLTRAGIVMSAFGLGSLLGTYIGGWLTDRIGYFVTMFGSLFLGGVSFLFLSPLQTFEAWCIGVFVVGTIADAFRPANLAALGIYSKPENQTRSLSLIRIAANMGLAIGPAIGGLVAVSLGYNLLFYLDGLTCMLAAFAFYFLLPKKEVHTDNKIETIKTPKSLSAYKDIFFLKFVFYMFLSMVTFMHFINILVQYWKDHFTLNEFQIGLMFTINCLFIGLFEMPIIYVLDKRFKVFHLIMFGAALIGLGYVVYPLLDFWKGAVFLSLILITIGEIINFPFLNTVALDRAPSDRRGEYMGLYGISFSLALILAPTFGGRIAEVYGYNTLWIILGIISAISIVGFYSLQGEYEAEQSKIKVDQQKKLNLVG